MKTEKSVRIILQTQEECERLQRILRIFSEDANDFFRATRHEQNPMRRGETIQEWKEMAKMAESLSEYAL